MSDAERKARSRQLQRDALLGEIELAQRELHEGRRAVARIIGGTRADDQMQLAADALARMRIMVGGAP